MDIPLSPAPGRTAGIMRFVRQRIAAREWPPGARLPSLRAMAQQHGVSKSTVVEAYDRLAAEGAIRARPGAGFYVAGPLAPLALAEIGPRLDRQIDPLWVSRQSLDLGAQALKPGCGWLPDDWMPRDAIRRALRQVARDPAAPLTDYAPALGLPALRTQIARHLGTRGLAVDPRHILLTDSGTQAVDLLCRFLIEPGDAVLVDDPCYFNFLALLRAHRARIVGVPHTPDGPDMDRFEAALREHRPRLYLSNAGPHNPTGARLSAAKARRIRALAHDHDLILIEDDIFGDFESRPAARLAADDSRDRVAQVGSFSKTLSASLRCGYLIAREDWLDALADLRTATTFSGAGLTQAVIARLLRDGAWQQHTRLLRQRLALAMPRAIRLLGALGLRPWHEPEDGMFLWCRLPDGIDGARLAQAGLQQGLMLAPGNVFSQAQAAGAMMRFNVSQMDDPRLPDRLATLIRTCPR
ncbi:PLP-dependent aminotransferase family protein [Castellaniella defragrans]|uniref:Transcriptional regulator, GntR family domain / Aspartate aminotransferase n=2 Tax=Castellaniella defragrans TaxID=75697 RepID=W8X5Z3_CASD6|nr:PLP-dependent aminotransferase family protein [Castellaniella defragrans]KAB0624137.1 PLP-dependent aminotransferase family protein [Castellaniella defragrans]MBB6082626.1 DNA-binding transcriptional MocR family regulator [Castellaniella defragrans]CDM25606.1 Transcriptional regulator, GntR family domain / Aspartate aminotransferase [Castellaniella defragrans 65Phen]